MDLKPNELELADHSGYVFVIAGLLLIGVLELKKKECI